MDAHEANIDTRRTLATAKVRKTVEEAPREGLPAEAQRREVEALSELRGMDLADSEVMLRAWRQ
jgi:hypothetical protein